MKTAIEILEEQLYEWLDGRIYLPPAFFEQAKEMEKKQMLEVSKAGCFSTFEFEQYYNQTFKSE
jgi:hypothetical protein